ncbi:MAG: ABC transporter substrate-binding protein [Candidatus Polarisedimenticolia bacterium]
MSKRRSIAVALAVLLVASPAWAQPVQAQAAPESRGPLIAVLLSQRIEPFQQTLDGFRQAFAGSEPEPTFRVVDLDGAPSVDATQVGLGGGPRPDLYLAIGARAARALSEVDLGAPLVVASVADARLPEGRERELCGVGMEFPYALQFQTLRAIAPRVRTVGALYEKRNRALATRAEAAAREQGLRLVRAEIVSVQEIPAALEELMGKVDALWALPDATVFSQETSAHIILQTLRRRLPFMGFSDNFVKAGSLLSLYADFEDIGLQAGGIAREILAGRRPPGGGLVPPRRSLLAVNLRVADVIGLPVPPAIRKRASAIYE